MGSPDCLTAEVGNHTFPKPRILLDVVLSNAHKFPEKIWASVPISQTDPAEGYRDLTYMQLHNAINRSAWWLANTFQGKTSREFEPLAYIGTPDTRYMIFALTAIKAGFQIRSKQQFIELINL